MERAIRCWRVDDGQEAGMAIDAENPFLGHSVRVGRDGVECGCH